MGAEYNRKHTVQRQPLGIPCAVRERYNRHARNIMIQVIFRIVFFIEAVLSVLDVCPASSALNVPYWETASIT